ncbi:hypothetical protein DYP60_13635 [Sphaerochaeta halotolerans]|uniref:Uncharacterized protein n=1 Tax=Sphaerochaeta halotolerans TaxID=2293840 RepID=A0A372MD31_9SPIR|nr:hypothetical protein [Sphaerochaeta halotolerans]RFU93664.1 hypothetical protein DYP60_13635 [Sphaerochaeta halotolerans]
MLSGFPKSTISIINRDGEVLYQNIKAVFADNMFLIEDIKLIFEEGDIIEKLLPNGKSERYEILETGFNEGLSTIPAHFQTKVRKIIKHKAENIQGYTPSIINNTYSGVANLQVQQNTHNSSQVMNIKNGLDYEQIELILELLKCDKVKNEIPAERLSEFEKAKDDLESAIQRKDPKEKIKPVLSFIKNLIFTCGTSALSAMVVDQISKII